MAQRRSLQNTQDDPYGKFADDGSDGGGLFGGEFGGSLAAPPLDAGGNVDEFGNDLPDFNNDPNYPTPFEDYTPTAIIGNQEAARELGGHGWMSNTPRQNNPSLPQGVSVEERHGPEQGNAQDTPMMSAEPDPVSAHAPEPMQTPVGPQRRTMSNAAPALFAEAGGGGRMFGGADGLMGGGRGALGTHAGGPSPTEMMLSILRQMRGGV